MTRRIGSRSIVFTQFAIIVNSIVLLAFLFVLVINVSLSGAVISTILILAIIAFNYYIFKLRYISFSMDKTQIISLFDEVSVIAPNKMEMTLTKFSPLYFRLTHNGRSFYVLNNLKEIWLNPKTTSIIEDFNTCKSRF